jgi:type II secretory pathway pseudopilin PulG
MSKTLLAAVVSGVLAVATQYGLVTAPAKTQASEATTALTTIERLLDLRERQIERREQRVGDLEDRLEACEGAPIARGLTPALAARAEGTP